MSSEPSPYKAPNKAEQRRNALLLPLIGIPIGITAYLTYLKEGAKGPSWFTWRAFF